MREPVPIFIFLPPPSNTLSLPVQLSAARSPWLILMGCPLFVNVPSCVHHCRLSIIAGLLGGFSIWRHIWHSAASINVVIIVIFMSWGFTPFLSSKPLQPLPVPPPLSLMLWFFQPPLFTCSTCRSYGRLKSFSIQNSQLYSNHLKDLGNDFVRATRQKKGQHKCQWYFESFLMVRDFDLKKMKTRETQRQQLHQLELC